MKIKLAKLRKLIKENEMQGTSNVPNTVGHAMGHLRDLVKKKLSIQYGDVSPAAGEVIDEEMQDMVRQISAIIKASVSKVKMELSS